MSFSRHNLTCVEKYATLVASVMFSSSVFRTSFDLKFEINADKQPNSTIQAAAPRARSPAIVEFTSSHVRARDEECGFTTPSAYYSPRLRFSQYRNPTPPSSALSWHPECSRLLCISLLASSYPASTPPSTPLHLCYYPCPWSVPLGSSVILVFSRPLSVMLRATVGFCTRGSSRNNRVPERK